MSKEEYLEFLQVWEPTIFILAVIAFGAAILNFIFYRISFVSKKTMKEKFDLASTKETKRYLLSHILVAIAIFFLANTAEYEIVQLSINWFFIRFFIAICLGVLYGYVAQLVLRFYYPGKLEKKLKKLRYTPRTNPENGNRMKLLSEAEEDAYLDEGMQAEEDVFSVDYDVWIDPETGYTKIEKYKGHLSALECDRCGFQTLRLQKEEIIRPATETEDGELFKEYKCSYCKRIKRKTVILSHQIKDKSDTARLLDDPLSQDKRINVVKIEVHAANGQIKEYDFQSIDLAKKFLEEFDFEKIEQEV